MGLSNVKADDDASAHGQLRAQVRALRKMASDQPDPTLMPQSSQSPHVKPVDKSTPHPSSEQSKHRGETSAAASSVEQPAETAHSNEADSTGIFESAPDANAPKAPPKSHVLLVEDNVINQRIVSRSLQAKGFHVTTAANGEEAVKAVRDAPPSSSGDPGAFNIILMDQEMPVMDGIAATKAIREMQRRGEMEAVPILGVSANVRGAQQDAMLDSGMDGVIAKPYKIEDMVTEISRITGV